MSLNPYDDLLQTVRLETTRLDGKHRYGTGFLYDFCEKKIEKDVRSILGLVTNRHVIEDGEYGSFYLNRKGDDNECKFGNMVEIKFKKNDWIHHPDGNIDLSILPIYPLLKQNKLNEKELFIRHTYASLLPKEQQWNKFSPMEDIVTIGYPNGFWDEQNNIPIVRKGMTATHPKLNYKGKDQFLIDIPIYPGISGSPVFLMNYGYEWSDTGGYSIGNRCYFLGIIYAMAKYSKKHSGLTNEMIPTDNSFEDFFSLISNLGFVIKSTKLKDFDDLLDNSISQ
jgi:hypothetical protein